MPANINDTEAQLVSNPEGKQEIKIPDNRWQIFPNPAKGFATIVVTKGNGKYALSIADVKGRVVYNGKFTVSGYGALL